MCHVDFQNVNGTYKSASYFHENAFTVKTLGDTGLNFKHYTPATFTTTCMASFLMVLWMELEGDNAPYSNKKIS